MTSAPVLYVTGAASGIGAATARLALEAGWQVGLIDRDEVGLSTRDRTGADDLAEAVAADVTARESLEAAARRLSERWPQGPDAVVHCAGTYLTSPAAAQDLELFDHVQSVNTRGTYLAATTLARPMLARGSGSIVLLSSIAYLLGDRIEPGAAYAASKGAIVSLGRQLAVEWGPRGVRTNVVAPGVIDTPMTTIVEDAAAHAVLLEAVPLQRLGTAEEIARVCLFLAGSGSAYVNGAVLPVDGGQSVV